MYKVLKRDISFNTACSILEANHYNIAEVHSNRSGNIMMFIDKTGRKIARYTEKYGRLDVICD